MRILRAGNSKEQQKWKSISGADTFSALRSLCDEWAGHVWNRRY